jgi:hypothetical protein
MTSDPISKADHSGKSCAQPICHHLRREHLDGGASGKDHHCTLCKCSAYVSGPRMAARKMLRSMLQSQVNQPGG